jgi:hypothetical protein
MAYAMGSKPIGPHGACGLNTMRSIGAAATIALVAATLVAEESPRPLPNGNELVRSMVERQRSFEKALDEYTYDLLTTEAKLDDKDSVKEAHLRRYEIFFVKGQPVRRLVEEDGRPLVGAKAENELKRVSKAAEKARARKRSEKDEAENEARLSDILARYDFTALRRELAGGRQAVLVEFRAQPGKRDIKHENVLRAVQGRLWIDEDERAVVRAELATNQPIKMVGGLLASISRIDLDVDFVPVDEIWLPRRSQSFATGRVLFRGFRRRRTEEFSNYRRFVVSTEETVATPTR